MPNARFRSRGGTNSLLCNFSPGQVASQPLLDSSVEPTEVNKSLDKLRETLVSQSPTDHRLGFRNIVPFPERKGIAVGIGDERVGGRDKVGLGNAHELAARDIKLLSARNV